MCIGFEGKEMDVYLPADTWYDWYTHQRLTNGSESKVLTNVQTPLDHVPVSSEECNALRHLNLSGTYKLCVFTSFF